MTGKKKALNSKQNSDSASDQKKAIFYILTLLIPVLFLILLETGLFLFNYGGDTRLFIPIPDEHSPYYGINLKVGLRYFNGEDFCPTPRKDLFLRRKPERCYRIFVLGGSTTAGFPYGNNTTFPRILHRRLNDCYPTLHFEIVNMAMTAINSYTMLDYMDEILEQQPDALLIYAGHNEFYGALGVGSVESLGKSNWFVRLYLKLQKFKTVRLLRDIILQSTLLFRDNSDDINTADNTQTQMTRIVKDKEIFYNSALYNLGKKQFYNNLETICSKASGAGIKVLLSELVANIRDQLPLGSAATEELPSAFEVFKQARDLERSGNYQEARKAYYRAKDLDVVRFRAPEDFNDIIWQIGSRYNLPIVEMKKWFEQASSNGLIGTSLMHEHLHPNIDGYFLMADAFLQKIVEQRLIDAPLDKNGLKSSSYYRQTWGWTVLDSLYADLNILQLKGGWPFKKEGPNTALSEFIPKSKVDSISLEIQLDLKTLEQGHIYLASYYEQTGRFAEAFAEHKALIYTVPYLDLFYEPAIKLLVGQNAYKQALEILAYGIRYNQSPFIMKWLGQLNLVFGHTQRGIFYLEKVLTQTSTDIYVLFNLSRAYYKLSQFNKGDALRNRLKEIAPNSPYINELINYKNALINRSIP
jgi:lysophospholipase L1-like esterase